MHPILLTTPFFTLYTFGVLLAAAYLAALWWLVARRAAAPGSIADALTSLGIVGDRRRAHRREGAAGRSGPRRTT